MTPNLVFFSIVAALAAAGAVGVVWFGSAIRSALCLVTTFFMLAVLYFSLGAEMLGVLQVVVYTGAIMVLFLFVIMLLNPVASNLLHERSDGKRPIALLLGLTLALLLGSQILPVLAGVTHVGPLVSYGTPQAVGRTLFTLYAAPFEAVSILLLVGIVGSILLARRKA